MWTHLAASLRLNEGVPWMLFQMCAWLALIWLALEHIADELRHIGELLETRP